MTNTVGRINFNNNEYGTIKRPLTEGKTRNALKKSTGLKPIKPPPAGTPSICCNENTKKKLNELLMAVESKFDGESRFETALRYIREREAEQASTETKREILCPPPPTTLT